jgi:hypothetical protein
MTSPNPSCQAYGTSSETWNDEESGDEWWWGITEGGIEFGGGMNEEQKNQDSENFVRGRGTQLHRVKYGTGIDAQRTAQYRDYPVNQSRVLREVRCKCRCEKSFMMRLITAVLNDCPVDSRPAKPTRSEKRCRAGLVHWLDFHAELVFEFLASRPQFS